MNKNEIWALALIITGILSSIVIYSAVKFIKHPFMIVILVAILLIIMLFVPRKIASTYESKKNKIPYGDPEQ